MNKDYWAGWDVLMVWLFFTCVFIGYDPDGSVWRNRYTKLFKYEEIVENPKLLQEVLLRYQHIQEDLALLESGYKLRDVGSGSVIQCYRVDPLYDNHKWKEF